MTFNEAIDIAVKNGYKGAEKSHYCEATIILDIDFWLALQDKLRVLTGLTDRQLYVAASIDREKAIYRLDNKESLDEYFDKEY